MIRRPKQSAEVDQKYHPDSVSIPVAYWLEHDVKLQTICVGEDVVAPSALDALPGIVTATRGYLGIDTSHTLDVDDCRARAGIFL